MNTMNETTAGINQHEVLEKALEMMRFVQDACREGRVVHQVEEGLCAASWRHFFGSTVMVTRVRGFGCPMDRR